VVGARRVKVAQTLVRELPGTLAGLRDGVMSPEQGEVVVAGAWRLPPAEAEGLEAVVLARAAEQTVPQLRRVVARAVIELDPAGAERRHQQARRDRTVTLLAGEDGMAELRAVLPAADAGCVYARLDAAARLLPAQDPRPFGARRADLLVDGVLSGIRRGRCPRRRAAGPRSGCW